MWVGVGCLCCCCFGIFFVWFCLDSIRTTRSSVVCAESRCLPLVCIVAQFPSCSRATDKAENAKAKEAADDGTGNTCHISKLFGLIIDVVVSVVIRFGAATKAVAAVPISHRCNRRRRIQTFVRRVWISVSTSCGCRGCGCCGNGRCRFVALIRML